MSLDKFTAPPPIPLPTTFNSPVFWNTIFTPERETNKHSSQRNVKIFKCSLLNLRPGYEFRPLFSLHPLRPASLKGEWLIIMFWHETEWVTAIISDTENLSNKIHTFYQSILLRSWKLMNKWNYLYLARRDCLCNFNLPSIYRRHVRFKTVLVIHLYLIKNVENAVVCLAWNVLIITVYSFIEKPQLKIINFQRESY